MKTEANQSPGLVRLREAQAEEAASLLGEAFHPDPLFIHACPDPSDRARWLPWSFLWSVWKGLLFGEVLGTAGRLDGLAITVSPEGNAVDEELLERTVRRARASHRRRLTPAEREAWDRYDAVVGAAFRPADEMLHHAVEGPHWYLDAIAVAPAMQGRGIGSTLLRAVNQLAETGGTPIVLLTFQPANLPLYARHGYAVVCEDTASTSGPSWWGFRRDPGS